MNVRHSSSAQRLLDIMYMIIARAFLGFLLLCIVQTVYAGETLSLNKGELRFVEQTAKEIQKRFPPSQYYYVAVGRSPVLLVTYLKLKNPGSAGYLPATKAKWASNLDMVSEEDQTYLREHLKRFLPSDDELGGRKILLIDHVQSGLGLKRVQHYFNDLLRPKLAAESLALVFKPLNGDHIESDFKLIYSDKKQIQVFASEKFDDYAPYTTATLFRPQDLSQVSANPRFRYLVDALRSALKMESPSCKEIFSPQP